MGRVFKKKAQAAKRAVDREEEEEQKAAVLKKKARKEPTPEPGEPEESEDVEDQEEDEDVSDEEGEDVDDEAEGEDEEKGKTMNFEFEAYPPSEDDRDGIINMLTQTFLHTIDTKEMAEAIIAKCPHGVVMTQAYDDDETEEDYMVYALTTTTPLCKIIEGQVSEETPKFVKDIFAHLLNRAKKGAPSELYKKLEQLQEKNDGTTALFINERMLNIPIPIVPPTFASIRADIEGFNTKYTTILYIQKLRIAEGAEAASGASSSSGAGGSGSAGGKKKKMGKAEKKRAAAAALANSEIEFDNPEDRLLFELKVGKETHFDYPVHMDVEPGSQFHIIEKDGKKWNPFRRLVIMDDKRFDAFLKKCAEGVVA